MKKGQKAWFLGFFALVLTDCAVDPKKLDGAWRAFEFRKNGSEQAVALDEIRLFLDASRSRYTFSSLFKYREAGRFRSARGGLFLIDTTARPAEIERKIEVEKLTDDELWIAPADGELLKMRRDSAGKN